MAQCSEQIGVRNIKISFTDCDSNESINNVAHELATDALPEWRLCSYNNEPLPGGYVRRVKSNSGVTIIVRRDQRIPLEWYQGCAAVDIQVEYFNGQVITGINGTPTGDTRSDTYEVELDVSFRDGNVDWLAGINSDGDLAVSEQAIAA